MRDESLNFERQYEMARGVNPALAIALHAACILRKLGTGKPITPHLAGILRAIRRQ